ncbi:MAG: dihydropteroate synthase [Myxococcaceae bacterium]|nr:dihydropteroate synthase [Myxococcaceae bacterium]MBH2006541.1 dihydropteroate synthase [Myxococcaceae bacterium]
MKIIGILNCTPDSFSDGGRYLCVKEAIEAAQRLMLEGASWIDLGGESTRPGAQKVSPEEEQRRVLPIIRELASQKIPMSIDTRNANTAQAAFDLGVTRLNDISALTHDPDMLQVASCFEQVVLMHMRGTPETMQKRLDYPDLISDVSAYLHSRVQVALEAGLCTEQIVIDPGLGFGKSTNQCLCILEHLNEFASIAPLYLGASRKKFIGDIAGISTPADRDYATVGVALRALHQKCSFFRVHNVQAVVQAIKLFSAQSS